MTGPFYWCLYHERVEPAEGCANEHRLGPYETYEQAQSALERAQERTAAWDQQDAADNSWGRPPA